MQLLLGKLFAKEFPDFQQTIQAVFVVLEGQISNKVEVFTAIKGPKVAVLDFLLELLQGQILVTVYQVVEFRF